MPDFTVIHLKNFKGGLHLARGLTNSYDKTLDTLHSDKLKSALFVCALQLYGEAKIGKSFLESFQISSAFPFYYSPTNDQTFYFFPKPEVPFQLEEGAQGLEKKLKQVRFIEKSVFEQVLQGVTRLQLDRINLAGGFMTDNDLDFNSILERENCEAIMKTQPYQHVNIARDYGSDSVPYYVDKMYFHENAGLFFLLHTDDIATKEQVIAAMKLLADSGIGTDQNAGNGQFDFTENNMKLNTPPSGSHQLSLSLYCPEKHEVENYIHNSYYGLTKRGGYISSPADSRNLTIRKRSIYMFTEGSIFPFQEGRKGKIEDLAPDNSKLPNTQVNHPIWRDGQPIFVSFNYQSNES